MTNGVREWGTYAKMPIPQPGLLMGAEPEKEPKRWWLGEDGGEGPVSQNKRMGWEWGGKREIARSKILSNFLGERMCTFQQQK